MSISTRLVVAFWATLLASTTAAAPPPVAPEPHLALDELVKEYKRLGLPLPPANAELVRIERQHLQIPFPGAQMLGTGPHQNRERYDRYRNDVHQLSQHAHHLVYRVPPPKPGGRTRYLSVGWFGVGLLELEGVQPEWVAEVRPDPDAVRWVPPQSGGYPLVLAVQCKTRGWDDLAVALYARAREQFAADKSDLPALAALREVAWGFWVLRLTDRNTDRKELQRRLSALFDGEPALRTEYNEWLLGALDLTVAPRKSKPGTVEALIDGLTEYWDDPHSGRVLVGSRAETEWATYWSLAEQGLDAVPALIEHATDDRLTRAWTYGFNNFPDRRITVGHLCSRILSRLSAGESGSGFLDLPPDPAVAHTWLEGAKKVGEEKWLLTHALPPDKPIVDWKGCAEPLIVRVIGVKYPTRLPEVYRAWLRRPYTECWGDNFADEVMESKLPRDQKIALLNEGAVGDTHFRRVAAMERLARLDPVGLRKPLLAELTRIQLHAWLWHPGPVSPSSLLHLTEAAGDQACWDALAAVGKTLTVGSRLNLLELVATVRPPEQKDPHRLARIRFLVQFLDDRSCEICAAWDGVQVCDHAAGWLAILLGFRVEKPERCRHPVETRGPISRFFIRAAVAKTAAEELARLKK